MPPEAASRQYLDKGLDKGLDLAVEGSIVLPSTHRVPGVLRGRRKGPAVECLTTGIR
jgi:hypothetical protein